MNRLDWEALIQRHLDGVASTEEVAALSERIESDEDARMVYLRMAQVHAGLATDEADETDGRGSLREPNVVIAERSTTLSRWRWAGAVLAAGVLIAGVFLSRPWVEPEPGVATIVALEGSVRWTGDGGQVSDDLGPDQIVRGGTLECLTEDSSATLRFPDDTTATVTGVSVLTVSGRERKEWHLRRGRLSAEVTPQPEGKPLLIHTPAAELEVLGTRFEVTADPAGTVLTVNQGRVRLKRLTDGRVVEVPASHLAVATIEARDVLAATRVAGPTHFWVAEFRRDVETGEWFSPMIEFRHELGRKVESGEITGEEARALFMARFPDVRRGEGGVRAVATRARAEDNVVYSVTLTVSRHESGPVVLAAGSRFRVRGKVRSPAVILFGFKVWDGKRNAWAAYLTKRRVDGEFDLTVPLTGFRSREIRGKDGTSAVGWKIVNWYCLTESAEAELEITAVELSVPE